VKTTAILEAVGAKGESARPTPDGRSLDDLALDERRRMPRFLCEGTGEVIVLGGALRFTGQLLDLSATGCRMATEVMFRLERGTQVEVVMVVNRVHFRVAGGVRSNHKTRGVGLEFMNVSTRCARLIQELIAELESKAEREPARSSQQRA
jgi:PilZ domain